MADSSTEPILHRTPPELLSYIASFADNEGLNAITRVSKFCREACSRVVFKTVRFRDTHKRLSRALGMFIDGRTDQNMAQVREHIRHATITIIQNFSGDYVVPGTGTEHTSDWSNDWDVQSPADDTLPLRILQSTQLMANLRILALDLRHLSPAQVDPMVLAMSQSSKWETVTHLKYFASDDLTLAAISHCVRGTLQALSIDVDIDSLAYKRAVREHRERSLPAEPCRPITTILARVSFDRNPCIQYMGGFGWTGNGATWRGALC
ncbi:hypothetical protein BGZ61DRAFT_572617 [Ilyonectria robusta]|uniref:uncharacterized protein n=1 Tax=Ilyonectria robusta TaxID=1079257 RepID=UPI001E8E8EA2|nr:uncharacterized protein BGZ61DRAFT_572617 [Ilyonectria robusta]KAH8722224.1 hypothetical protein BGZ61DRAFT_572617 [Ilyonectria robusta]